MSKNEIKGLQQLAMANGGSLTINPETGLVEAGFLEQALPIVAAAAATYFTAGAAAPAIGTAFGIGSTGAGILAGAGAGALISGATAALTGKDVGQAALMGGVGGALSGGLGAYEGAPNLLADATQKAAVTGAEEAAKSTVTQGLTEGATQTATNALPTGYTGTAFTPAEMAAGSGPASSLNTGLRYDPSTGIGTTPMAGYGTATTGAPTQAGLEATRSFTGVQAPGAPGSSFYADQGTLGKAGLLALPALGLMQQNQSDIIGGQPDDTQYGFGLSPNFQRYQAPQPNPYYRAQYPNYVKNPYNAYAAEGGEVKEMAAGGMATGPVERMSQNMMGGQANMYPLSQQDHTNFATPTQMPASAEIVRSDYDTKTDPYTGGIMMAGGGLPADARGGMPKFDPGIVSDSDANTRGLSALEAANYRNKKLMGKSGIKMAEMPKTGIKSLGGDFSDVAAGGGTAHLGDYSDGGRLLKGPGDGMSDNIPATIGRKQPARLADGEFVVPADVVSHLGNGSTDAGAKKLYAMMDKIRRARTGKKKQAPAVKADKFMPA
jgi:hypothetical protein